MALKKYVILSGLKMQSILSLLITQRSLNLVNVDADKVMLWTKKDSKTLDNFIHQYKYAGNYVDRREAIEFASKNQKEPKAQELLKLALKDKYHGLRNYTLAVIDMTNEEFKKSIEPILADLAKNDKKSTVRASAMGRLGSYKKPEYTEMFKAATKDSSYTVGRCSIRCPE
jgi:aminopeptidase N